MSANTVTGSSLKTLLILQAIPLFFSSNIILGRALNTMVEPATLAFYRWSIATIILLMFSAFQLWKFRAQLFRVIDLLFILGFLGMFVSGAVFYAGLQQTTAIKGALIYMASPAIIVILEVFFRGARVSFARITGIIAAMTGVFIILAGSADQNAALFTWQSGDLYCIAASISWALYSVILKSKRLVKIPTVVLFSAIAIAGSIILFPFYLWENGLRASYDFSVETWVSIFFIASVSSVLAFGFYQKGVELVGASTTGLYLYLLPVYASVIAVSWLGEVLSIVHVIGFVLIAGGLYYSTRSYRDRQKTIAKNQ